MKIFPPKDEWLGVSFGPAIVISDKRNPILIKLMEREIIEEVEEDPLLNIF